MSRSTVKTPANPAEWEQRQCELDLLLKRIHRLKDCRDRLSPPERDQLDAELERLLRRHRKAREKLVAPGFHREEGRAGRPEGSTSYYADMQQAVERAMSRFGAPD